MNSQIYCLPQKLGWNALKETSIERAEQLEQYKNKRTVRPYYVLTFNRGPVSKEVKREFQRRYPRLPVPDANTETLALRRVGTSEYGHAYGPDFTAPMIRPCPPVTYEKRADPVQPPFQQFDPPFETLTPPKGSPSNDPDSGLYEWRELKVRPEFGIWRPMESIPFQTYIGERSTLRPVRLRPNDPTQEKEKWDQIRNLIRQNALSYGYRVEVPGYAGHRLNEEYMFSDVEKDIHHPNKAMESTAQASYKELPTEHYVHTEHEAINKHLGPLSRMVTLTHPYNPFTQQSAYCNVGATDTQ